MKPITSCGPILAIAIGVLSSVAAAPAQAGILINPKGIFLTGPTISQSPKAGPALGFRQFGRAGFFAAPDRVAEPFAKRTRLGHAGQKAPPHRVNERTLTAQPLLLFQ